MTQPPPTPSFRLKIPCADEREFRRAFAPKYVAAGIFVPSREPKPVGTRVRVKLELRSGQVIVSGDAMVTSRTPAAGSDHPGMTLRLTALDPESCQFQLSPAAASAAPASPPPAITPSPRPKLDLLFDADDEPPPAQHPAPPAAALAPLVPDDALEFAEAEPTPQPVPARAPAGGARPIPVANATASTPASPEATATRTADRHRIGVWIAAGVAIVAVVGAVIVVATQKVGRPRARDAAPAADARVAAALGLADTRLVEGRLAGPAGDSALDHLLSAKAAAPDDPRVKTRLGLLADKFEELGDRALARRNLREAEVHFAAAVRSDPRREAARRKLAEIAAAPDGATPTR